ncbi:uncharacterized protein LOC122855729 [Aphidius gifuensis]|uniref:uncharacterized protein LOC122855729 n=1 Tax=Aphidius gifuensis TaxID=684658 RepID=UPI001CDBED5B|nr:uncharacterized protein LOC122855729 [Aphidius gifuensis]
MNLFIFYVITGVMITINGKRIEYNQTLIVKERNCTLSKFSRDSFWKNCEAVYYLDCVVTGQEIRFSVYKSDGDKRGTEFYEPAVYESINLTRHQRVKEFCAYVESFKKVRQQQTLQIQSSCEQVDVYN